MSFGMKKKQKKYFKYLRFKVLIEKLKFKHLSNIKLLPELPFYDELSDELSQRSFSSVRT